MDDISGRVFGRWTVLAGQGRKVLCECDCGTNREVNRYTLIKDASTSCGCRRDEASAVRGRERVKHRVSSGDRFGRWLVLDAADRCAVKVRCECGTESTLLASNLVSGASTSCGCWKQQKLRESYHPVKHGLSYHPLYDAWYQMVKRCTNPQHPRWADYGGRGIRVHDAWTNVSVFVAEIEQLLGPRPDGLTIDRIDNDGNYEPGNVRWATYGEQVRNRRPVPKGLKRSRRRRT